MLLNASKAGKPVLQTFMQVHAGMLITFDCLPPVSAAFWYQRMLPMK